jgi:PAS domain S-box-containing protein
MKFNLLDDRLSQEIRGLENRLVELQQVSSLESNDTLKIAFQELENSLAELCVAHEELVQQNQELQSALHAAEERQRYQDLFDLAPDGYLVTDPGGIVQEANRIAINWLNIPLEFLLNKPLRFFVMQEDQTVFDQHLSGLVKSQQPGELEVRLQRAGRSSFPSVMTANPWQDGQGQIAGIRWLIHDITERKRAEDLLRRREQESRALVENNPDIILRVDKNLRSLYANPVAQKSLGFPAELIIGKTLEELGAPEAVAARWRGGTNAVFETGQEQSIEFALSTRRGQKHYYARLVPELGPDGEVATALGIAREVTDLKLTEEELVREKHQLQALLDTSPVAIVVVDSNFKVKYANQETQRIYGSPLTVGKDVSQYQQAASVCRSDGSILPSDEWPLYRALKASENVRAEELRLEFPDGHAIPILANASPIWSPEEKVIGAIATLQDITSLDEEARLRQDFLGIVSHELRSPLSTIKGVAATLLESRRPFNVTESQQLYQIIDTQVEQLMELVNNLLDMSCIEAGALSIKPEPTDLQKVLEEALDAFARRNGPRYVRLKMPDDLPPVMADRHHIGQVFANLLDNAARFSPPGSPISISLEYNATQVKVHLRDWGRGIPREKLSRLFKPFSQVHDDLGSKFSGAGLGLAICKGIIEAHGGRIWANSTGEGKGATFDFTLPLAVSVPALSRLEESAEETVQESQLLSREGSPEERIRILVVDDDPYALRLIRRHLQEAGFQAIVTTSSAEVIKLVELEEPDVVLLDVVLPGRSGLDLLQQIREFSRVPIIFLTARDREEEKIRALRMGGDDYITKPFSPTELIARIEVALRKRLTAIEPVNRPALVINDLTIDFARRLVTREGQTISLSPTEYRLLYQLATNAGRVLTHEQLLKLVWGEEYSGETDLVRSMIRSLRHKLGDDARRPRYIFTEPQVGYHLTYS